MWGSAVAAAALLSACVHDAPEAPGPNRDACCTSPERQPAWLVAIVEPVAPIAGRLIGHIVWRRGYLADPAVQAEIVAGLRPLDLVAVSSKGRLSGRTIPGVFQHVAIYLGTEADIRALGIWSHPAVVPHHDALASGPVFVEADMKGVHLSPPSVVFDTDRVVAMRPVVGAKGWRRRAALALFAELGGKFDFNFDAGEPSRVFCVELACRAMPELRLPRDRLYGRDTILPDRVAEVAARGTGRLRFLAYVAGDRDGVTRADRQRLRRDLDAGWAPR